MTDLAQTIRDGQAAYRQLQQWLSAKRDEHIRALRLRVSASNTAVLPGHRIERLPNLVLMVLLSVDENLPEPVLLRDTAGRRLALTRRSDLVSYLRQLMVETNRLHNLEELFLDALHEPWRRLHDPRLSEAERRAAAFALILANSRREALYRDFFRPAPPP